MVLRQNVNAEVQRSRTCIFLLTSLILLTSHTKRQILNISPFQLSLAPLPMTCSIHSPLQLRLSNEKMQLICVRYRL